MTSTVKPSCKIGPSILNADLSSLYESCVKLMDCGADYLHLDVMDGHFVPNLTFGHPVVKCLRPKLPDVYFDMHMMVDEPEKWVSSMADAGANQYTFHLEATDKPINLCRTIREAGMKVGIGLKPATPVSDVLAFIDHADVILIMTVEPGFGGQKFLEDMMPKVKFIRENFPEIDIEVDGGVDLNSITACAKAGANMIVSGNAVVNAPDPKKVITSLRDEIKKYH